MGKLKNNQKGFTAVEILLTLIFLAIIAAIGVYVAHNNKSSSPTTATKTSDATSTTPALSLNDAITQAQTTYTNYEKQVLDGQVLQDKSQWATSNVTAAEDLQFINANSTMFTSTFVAAANKYETDNTAPPGGGFLICESGIAEYNSDLKVTGTKLSGQTATVAATYTVGHSPSTTYTLPVTLKASGTKWSIDSIDLSSCN
jgi:hypothetical protein